MVRTQGEANDRRGTRMLTEKPSGGVTSSLVPCFPITLTAWAAPPFWVYICRYICLLCMCIFEYHKGLTSSLLPCFPITLTAPAAPPSEISRRSMFLVCYTCLFLFPKYPKCLSCSTLPSKISTLWVFLDTITSLGLALVSQCDPPSEILVFSKNNNIYRQKIRVLKTFTCWYIFSTAGAVVVKTVKGVSIYHLFVTQHFGHKPISPF